MSLNLPGNTAVVARSQPATLARTTMNGMKTFSCIREAENNRAVSALKSSSSLSPMP